MTALTEEEKTVMAEQAGRKVWLTYKEAAAYLGVSVSTLYTLRGQKAIKAVRLVPGRRTVRFSRAMLDRYMEIRGKAGAC